MVNYSNDTVPVDGVPLTAPEHGPRDFGVHPPAPRGFRPVAPVVPIGAPPTVRSTPYTRGSYPPALPGPYGA